MHMLTEWRYYQGRWKAILLLYLASFAIATSTHSYDLITGGMYRVAGIPGWINWFWFALTFIDPFAAIMLVAWVPAGVALMVAIIYADVAINAYVSLTLGGVSSLLNFFFACQFGFLLFITVTAAPLLRSVSRCKIAESDRLYLRPLRPGDVNSLALILTEPVSMAYYPRPYTLGETREWIARNRRRYRKYGYGLWAVVLKGSNRWIGECGVTLQNIDGEILPEIGYHILGEYRGNGYAPEAASLALEYCDKRFGIKEFYSYCETGNLASRRVMEKLGLTPYKTYPENGREKIAYRGVLP